MFFGRIPHFEDGLEHQIYIFSTSLDERILLAIHFLIPFLLLICFTICIVEKYKPWKILIVLFFITFEVLLRFSDFYGYLMFD